MFLAGCGLVAVGISGLVALVMNVAFGRSFVGGTTVFPGVGPGPSVTEAADDAVVLRVLAGLVGLFVLLGYLAWRRYRPQPTPLLPCGLVDALGAAAFAAGTAAFAIVAADQAAQTGTAGVGFALSGASSRCPRVCISASARHGLCCRSAPSHSHFRRPRCVHGSVCDHVPEPGSCLSFVDRAGDRDQNASGAASPVRLADPMWVSGSRSGLAPDARIGGSGQCSSRVERETQAMIHACGLSKRYGSTLAVDELSFDVVPGRVMGRRARRCGSGHCGGSWTTAARRAFSELGGRHERSPRSRWCPTFSGAPARDAELGAVSCDQWQPQPGRTTGPTTPGDLAVLLSEWAASRAGKPPWAAGGIGRRACRSRCWAARAVSRETS